MSLSNEGWIERKNDVDYIYVFFKTNSTNSTQKKAEET